MVRVDIPRGLGLYVPEKPEVLLSISDTKSGFIVKPAGYKKPGQENRLNPYELYSIDLGRSMPKSSIIRGTIEEFLKELRVEFTNLHRLDNFDPDEIGLAVFGVEITNGGIAGSLRYGIGELNRKTPPPSHPTFLDFIKLHAITMMARERGLIIGGPEDDDLRKLLDF